MRLIRRCRVQQRRTCIAPRPLRAPAYRAIRVFELRKKRWRTRGDLNSQPSAPEADALSIEPRVRCERIVSLEILCPKRCPLGPHSIEVSLFARGLMWTEMPRPRPRSPYPKPLPTFSFRLELRQRAPLNEIRSCSAGESLLLEAFRACRPCLQLGGRQPSWPLAPVQAKRTACKSG
jgi:hypothetical protein